MTDPDPAGITAAELALFTDTLFQGLMPAELPALLARCPLRALAPGEALLRQGAPNDRMYLLLAGRLRIDLATGGGAASIPVQPGESVGDWSLIDGSPASAGVVAETPSRVLVVPAAVFWSELVARPAVARNLLRMLVGRVRARADLILTGLRQELHQAALKKELDAARAVQTGMLPAGNPLCPQHPRLDLHALMLPAEDVGGDFYDVLALDERRLLLTVGDVAGKGMPAALFMMRVLTVVRMAALRGGSADDLLGRVNAELCRHNPTGMFATLCVLILDLTDGTLTLFNGGHPPPLRSRNGGPFSAVPTPPGLLVGILDSARYPRATLILAPGDRLLLYSDGATDAENAAAEPFGSDRLRQTLDDCLAGHPSTAGNAADLCAAVIEALRHHAGTRPQFDDVTLLALGWRPTPTLA